MTIYNKTTLQNFRKENLVEIVKHQEDEIEKLNQEKEILQCDLDNANSKLKELLENDKKIIEENYKEIERLNKCIDEALEIIIKDWNDKCTIPIHAVVDTGDDIRIKLYYQLFLKGVDKE